MALKCGKEVYGNLYMFTYARDINTRVGNNEEAGQNSDDAKKY